MGIHSEIQSGVLIIRINGRFDFGVHHEFREAVKLIEKGVKQVEVDLSGAEYMDSSALGMMLVLRDKLGTNNLVQIKNARNDVKKILEVANFDKLFAVK